MRLFCQVATLSLMAINFFALVYRDFNGRKELKPLGFSGFISTVIATVVGFLLAYGAGAFSEIIK